MDPSSLQPLFDWLSSHPGWAGLIVFLIALTESLIIFGLIVPGTLMMLGVGALIGAGVLPFWSMALWAMLGAAVGDGISYWVGHRYRHRLRGVWPLSRQPQLLDKGEAFFRKHGGKSVLFGRFIGPVRPVIPAVAGMMAMPRGQFYLVNIFSAIAWAPVTLLPGMVLGASLSLAAAVAGRLAVFIVLLIVLLWLALLISRRVYRFLSPRAASIIEAAMRWAGGHRYLGSMVVAELDPRYSTFKGLSWLGVVLLPAMLAAVAVYALIAQPAPMALDVSLQHFLQDLHTPLMDQLMLFGHMLLQWPPLLALSLTMMLSLWLWRQLRLVLYFVAAALFITLTAWLVGSPLHGQAAEYALAPGLYLPWMWWLLMSALLAAGVALFLPPMLRVIPYLVAVAAGLFAALALLYFSQVWFSELLLGAGLALIWALALSVAMRRHMQRSPAYPRALLVSAAACVLVMFWWADAPWREQALAELAPQVEQRRVTHATWIEIAWRDLPAQRLDLRAAARQPLALQWQGSVQEITQILAANGWHQPTPLAAHSWLQWFAPDGQLEAQPLLPRIHDGHYEQFKWVRMVGEELQVMRFWRSDYLVDGEPLFLVSVTWEGLFRPLGMMAVPRTLEKPITLPALLADWQGIVYRQQQDGRILLWQAGK